jgi:C4-dicarboxylate transporter, DctM subunit
MESDRFASIQTTRAEMEMSLFVASLVASSTMLLFLALGVHIAVAMALPGIILLYAAMGATGVEVIANVAWNSTDSWLLSAVPLFMFMGQIILTTGLSVRLYGAIGKLLEGYPGSLLLTNILACAVFSSISGSSVSTTATISTVAIPEMLVRRKYDRKLTLGSLAAGGALGILHPPSIPMIIYASITQVSLGKLFIAGIVPWILMSCAYMAYVFLRVKINPNLIPKEAPSEVRQSKWRLFADLAPTIALVLVVLGTMYTGAATPIEAAGVGAGGALLIAASYRQLTWSSFKQSLIKTASMTCMIIFILVGAQILAAGLSIWRIPATLAEWVVSLHFSPDTLFIAISAMFLILGCFIEALPMMLLTMPVLLPILTAANFDLVWFGVMLVIYMEVALIHPPVGMNLFVVQAVAGKHGSYGEMVAGTLPFLGILWMGFILFTIFPKIVTWLPSTM